MTNKIKLSALLTIAACLAPASSQAFFGFGGGSREALRALVRAKHTPALENALCGKAMSITFVTITVERGLSCPEEPYRDNGDHVILSAKDLAEAGFEIGFHDGEPHLSLHGQRGWAAVISKEEVGQILEGVQKEEEQARQRRAVESMMPLQGRYSIEDLFNAAPR